MLLCPWEILNLRQQYRRLSGILTQNKNKSEFSTLSEIISVFIVFVFKLVLKDPSTDLWKYFLNISGKMPTSWCLHFCTKMYVIFFFFRFSGTIIGIISAVLVVTVLVIIGVVVLKCRSKLYFLF